MHLFVLPGTDNEASSGFIYQKGSPQVANHEIKGETIENDLVLIGIPSIEKSVLERWQGCGSQFLFRPRKISP